MHDIIFYVCVHDIILGKRSFRVNTSVIRKITASVPVRGGHHQQEKVRSLFPDPLPPSRELRGHRGAAFLITLVPVSTWPWFFHTIARCRHPLPPASRAARARASRVLCPVVALWPPDGGRTRCPKCGSLGGMWFSPRGIGGPEKSSEARRERRGPLSSSNGCCAASSV